MKTAAISLALCLALCYLALCTAAARADSTSEPATRTAAAPATAPSGPISQLMAHGSARYFWLAEVNPALPGAPPRRTSTLYLRSVQGGDWQEPITIEDGIVDMANQDNELVVLLDSGEWRRLPEFTGNTPLPSRQRILAIAAAGQTLWAVGPAGPAAAGPVPASEPADSTEPDDEDQPAATQPAAAPLLAEAATTAPATRPAASLHLWTFPADAGAWVDRGELPARAASGVDLCITVVAGDPYLAFYAGGRIRTYRFVGGAKGPEAGADSWQDLGAITPDRAATGPIKFLATPQRPVLWVGGPGGGWFWVHSAAWSAPQPIGLAIGTPSLGRSTVAVAGEEIRFLVIWGRNLYEQSYDFGLVLTKPLTEVPIGASAVGPVNPMVGRLAPWVISALLLLVIVATVGRRRAPVDVQHVLDAVQPAPLGRRLAAGLIDLLPVLAGAVWIVWRFGPRLDAGADATGVALMVMPALVGLYLLHTLTSELVIGRSLGKSLCGLRVVDYDGQRPKPPAIILRNLMRIADLIVLPLGLILLTPLRQRLGDAVAGTVVVSANAKRP